MYSSLSSLYGDDSGGGFSSLLVGFWSMLFPSLVTFLVDVFGRTTVIPTSSWEVMFQSSTRTCWLGLAGLLAGLLVLSFYYGVYEGQRW